MSVHQQLLEMERADRQARQQREAKQTIGSALFLVQSAYGLDHPAVVHLKAALETLKDY